MKDIVKFFFELGNLKRVKRSGWWLINIKDPESVAEHSFRTAAIGYTLSKMEKVNTEKVTLMCLFNDLHEARLNDLHKLGHRYIDFKSAESKTYPDQLKNLPDSIKDDLKSNLDDFQSQKSKEAVVARDADLLECACQAKEYIDIGYSDAKGWMKSIKTIIKTESAKKLLKEIETESSNSWFEGLKKIDR